MERKSREFVDSNTVPILGKTPVWEVAHCLKKQCHRGNVID